MYFWGIPGVNKVKLFTIDLDLIYSEQFYLTSRPIMNIIRHIKHKQGGLDERQLKLPPSDNYNSRLTTIRIPG